jgi:hypothetical protein
LFGRNFFTNIITKYFLNSKQIGIKYYDFEIYIEYLRKISNLNTKIIFDAIRPDYFLKIFKNVKVIALQENTTHKSKRILCSQFLK